MVGKTRCYCVEKSLRNECCCGGREAENAHFLKSRERRDFPGVRRDFIKHRITTKMAAYIVQRLYGAITYNMIFGFIHKKLTL